MMTAAKRRCLVEDLSVLRDNGDVRHRRTMFFDILVNTLAEFRRQSPILDVFGLQIGLDQIHRLEDASAKMPMRDAQHGHGRENGHYRANQDAQQDLPAADGKVTDPKAHSQSP